MNLEPLYGLRVRTPRLELRLPTEAELVELYEVAAAGIHPPEEMPFAVPWTDDLTLESFLGYYRWQRESWRPESWSLELGTWADGILSGVRAVHAEDFAATRVVGTGSWLGSRFQGQGVGTEMRTGVVELAFRELGAAAVTSSAFEASAASRGVPMPHLQLRLERDEWRGAPFPVEVEDAAACLPLFGAG